MNYMKRKKDGVFLKIFESTLYIIIVVIGFYLAFLIRFNMNPSMFNIQPFYDSIPYIVITSIIIFYIYDIVSTVKKSLFENILIIGISLFLIDIVTVAIVFFNRGFAFPRSVFAIGFCIQFFLIFLCKILIINIIRRNRKVEELLIIASHTELDDIIKSFLLSKFNFNHIKFVCNQVDRKTYELINKVDKVYIGNDISQKEKVNLIKYCSEKKKTIYILPGLFEIALINSKITQINDMLAFKIEDIGLSSEQKVVKRILDIIISVMALIISTPLLLIVAIIIKLYDKGPIFYKQKRVTENNKIFDLYKFRTMIVDAEKQTGPILASEKDTRITQIGRLLRSTRIDELPQLINVLKGDMSIVGPRPERPFFVEKFNNEIEVFKYRVFVKAGITGLAQILGKYSTVPEKKAKFDLLYIKNYSLLLDIKIIFNTIKIMFLKESAAGVMEDFKIEDMVEELNLKAHNEL